MIHRKGIMSVLLGLGILAVSLALSTPRTALSQGAGGGKDVRVVNAPAEAVPVQLQPGATVGIAGTPAVSIAGPVALAGTTPVQVQNPAATPVYVQVVKAPARKPWQASVNLDLADGETSKFVALPDPPPGKRIVIESGSAQLLVLKEQVPYIQLFVSMTGSDPSVAHYFSLANVGSYAPAQYVWEATHPLKLTSAQGSVRVLRAGGSNNVFFASLSLSGYLEDNE